MRRRFDGRAAAQLGLGHGERARNILHYRRCRALGKVVDDLALQRRAAGHLDATLRAFFAVLKPGGVLGVEEHRAAPGTPLAHVIASGYVPEELVIEHARAAGFELTGRSDVKANPRDTRDHPNGVWSLPPTLRGGDVERAKFIAIGESDRMTLRFVKPLK